MRVAIVLLHCVAEEANDVALGDGAVNVAYHDEICAIPHVQKGLHVQIFNLASSPLDLGFEADYIATWVYGFILTKIIENFLRRFRLR